MVAAGDRTTRCGRPVDDSPYRSTPDRKLRTTRDSQIPNQGFPGAARSEVPTDTAKGVEIRITLAEIAMFRKQYAVARERLDECTVAIERKPALGRYGEQVKTMLEALPH